ncbi:MAG: hypothetical protein KGN36_01600, partial [Acidobacteriota bacterium]|nr:hypothetical protein [Acidobacteriota bacterium]
GHRMESFLHPGNVTAAVEAVVFGSGQFAGADRYGAYAIWDAEIHAPRDLAAAVLSKQAAESAAEIAGWIEGMAAVRRPADDPRERETILAARVLLAAYRNRGEGELFARARKMLEGPAFPLHR